MIENNTSAVATLTGRIGGPPDQVLHDDVLEPQFRYEAEHLLPYYLQVEKVLLVEYERMDVLDDCAVRAIAAVLDDIAAEGVTADPDTNLSDIALAIERQVTARLRVPTWHVDRSRNDLQASAQLMFGRAQTLSVMEDLLSCATAAQELAARYTNDVMPGYTHLQAAQVITPGFFVSAISAHLLHTVRRMLATYDGFNLSPLGCGALAGQELDWDRHRMADLLAFAGPQPHALVGVVSRSWVVELAAECSTFGVGLSRLVTDLMTWAGSEHGLIELPDGFAAISSAMPQKKNYPVFERIRGRTAHLTAWYMDVAMTQHATPYSNTVEVSKESSAQLGSAVATLRSLLRLLSGVLDNIVFRTEHARVRCTEEYLGGFSLANRLTLEHSVPWREAQVIAGRFVVAALATRQGADMANGALLTAIAERHGYTVTNTDRLLREAFDPEAELMRRRSPGAAHPDQVRQLLRDQEHARMSLATEVTARRDALDQVSACIDGALGATSSPSRGERS